MNKPQVFTVLQWVKLEQSRYSTNMHVVAAFDSEGAEIAFREQFGKHSGNCQDEFYIVTDELRADYPAAAALYVTRYENRVHTGEEYLQWQRSSLNPVVNEGDGNDYPAAYRRMRLA